MEAERVKVRVRFKPEAFELGGGRMWARPVRAHDGGGTYELRNTSFYVPLAIGDVVRAELDGDGVLQVTDVVCPGPGVMSWAHCREGEDVAVVADRWLTHGSCWSEGAHGMVATTWREGVDRRRVDDVLSADLRAGHLTWARTIDPDERVAEAQQAIEFALDDEQVVPDFTTSYWAPDDPFWAAHGLDSPEFLAHIQALAGDVEEVATALEAGDHDVVREILAFINDGPLW